MRRGAPRAPTPRRRRRWAATLLLAVALLLVPAGSLLPGAAARAHAVLVESDPPDGASLSSPPGEVTLRFNEPVTLVEGGLRVHDAEAERVDAGVTRRGGDGTVGVALPDDLPEGGYLVVYRVMSEDAHPVRGVVGFEVGDAAAVTDEVAVGLLGDDAVVGVLGALLRGLTSLGTLLAAGAVAGLLLLAGRDDDRRRARRLGVVGAGAGLAASVLALPVQTMAASGVGPLAALDPTATAETLGSSFGQGWLVRVAALALLAGLLRWTRTTWALAGAAVVAPASFLLDGHTRTMEPAWLLVAGDAVHLAAGALWLGGLVLLAWALRARRLEDDPVGAARLVARFSRLALWSVAALAVTGGAMAWALVRVPGALTTTGYGWTLLAKVTAVAVVVAVAAHNRTRLVPAIARRDVPAGGSVDTDGGHGPAPRTLRRSQAAWARLASTLTVEALLVAGVVLLTGFLVVQRPAADAVGATGLYDTRAPIADGRELEVVVDPNRAGETNVVHLYVLDASGRPAGDVEEVGLELLYEPEDVGPFRVEPFSAGPGHWIAEVDELAFPGDWRLTAVIALDRFEEERVEVTVPVR